MIEPTPPVAILMGSQSDWATLRHAADTLDSLGIAHDDRIISAHRTPDRLITFCKGARSGNDVGEQLVLEHADPILERQLALLHALDANRVRPARIDHCRDGRIKIAVLLAKLGQLPPDIGFLVLA